MKLVIPAMFGEGFLDDLAPYPVRWMYGSLPEEPGGRPRAWLPSVDLAGFGQRIADARERGIGFMYTLNASCSGNREQTAEGQRALAERLGWLIESGAEGVVATSPYVVEMVKRRFPELRVCVSTLANVDDVDKALYFENLGVEAIYVPEYLNRDFKLLRALRRRLTCDLVLTVNLGCLARCPLRDYHANAVSHASESLDLGCYVDYSLARCTQIKAEHPVEMLKATWIRPEDLSTYEEIGYSHFKLAGREQGETWVLRAVAAYAGRRYEALLNDLVISFESLAPFGQLPVRVDNRQLDGFLEYFKKKDCRLGCLDCTHCASWVQRAVLVEEETGIYAKRVGRTLDRFVNGTFRAPVARAR